MTSFGWKRKVSDKVSKESSSKFKDVTGSSDSDEERETVDEGNIWLSLAKRRKLFLLEDNVSKSRRLKNEGMILAEEERFWEAIKRWDEALQLTPNDEMLHEMKAQSYMMLQEVFPAVQSAEKAVGLNPRWWVGHQTLGRAQLGLGEIKMAILSFSRAVHINPDDTELWEEDLRWAVSLSEQKKVLEQQKAEEEKGTVT